MRVQVGGYSEGTNGANQGNKNPIRQGMNF